jgi:hypothetical protein
VDWLEPWEEYDFDYDLRPIDAERVLALCTMRARGRRSHVDVEIRFGQLWTFRAATPVRMVLYPDPANAIAAAEADP